MLNVTFLLIFPVFAIVSFDVIIIVVWFQPNKKIFGWNPLEMKGYDLWTLLELKNISIEH